MRPVKLLLDENLSPTVALRLRAEGIDVVHVRDRGLLAGTDAEVFAKAFEEDRVVVTSNIDDFVPMVIQAEVHGGVVLVAEGDLLRDEQELVLRNVVTVLAKEYAAGRQLVNRVLMVSVRGTWSIKDLP